MALVRVRVVVVVAAVLATVPVLAAAVPADL
jgi:hypothetical protein